MKYIGFKYCLKVWLTAALFTPIALTLISFYISITITGSQSANSYQTWLGGCLMFSILLVLVSLIPWLIVLSFFRRLTDSSLSLFAQKLVMLSVVTLIPSAFLLLGAWASQFENWQTTLLGWIAFVISTALCLWFYRLKPIGETAPSQGS
jgi:hypothetical protein